jgi:Family of unknown function (DUF6496)
MPEQKTIERARKDAREGKAPSTQAGEFVREEIEHVREGKHGVLSPEQAIAIGLSKARRAGIKVKPPANGSRSKPSAKRSRATEAAPKKEGHSAASHRALSQHAKRVARTR